MRRGFGERVPAWPPLAAAVALAGAVAAATIAPMVVAIPAAVAGAERVTPLLALATVLLAGAGVVVVVLRVAALTRPVTAAQLGLRAPDAPVRAAALALAVALGIAALAVAWSFVADVKAELTVPAELDPRSAVAQAYGLPLQGAVPWGPGLLASALARCVAPALVGELLLRGFAFPALVRWRGPLVAGVIVAALFGGVGAVASAPALAVPAIALGGALCALYLRTGSLLPGIALSAAAAAVAFGLACALSGPSLVALALGCAVVSVGVALPVCAPHGRSRTAAAGAAPAPGLQRAA